MGASFVVLRLQNACSEADTTEAEDWWLRSRRWRSETSHLAGATEYQTTLEHDDAQEISGHRNLTDETG